MYLMTHAYFLFYHALANVVLRRVRGGPLGGLRLCPRPRVLRAGAGAQGALRAARDCAPTLPP